MWAQSLREYLTEGVQGHYVPRPGYPEPGLERIPFDEGASFYDLTCRALSVALEETDPYRALLRLLRDCGERNHGRAYPQQPKGATYKQLALIAHLAGLSREERATWYGVAESVPLAQRHASHIITKLKGAG